MLKTTISFFLFIFLLAMPSITFAADSYLYCWVDDLCIRTKPGLKARIIGKVKIGEGVRFLNRKSRFKSKIKLRGKWFYEKWLKIKTEQAVVGWVFGGALGDSVFTKFRPKKLMLNLPNESREAELFQIGQNRFVYSGERDRNYGLKIILLRKTGEEYQAIYKSKGSYDSYVLEPHFYRIQGNKKITLILCRMGTEYDWGVRVFLYKSKGIKDVGYLHISAFVPGKNKDLDNAYLTSESVINHSVIVKKKNKIIFSFTKNLIYALGSKKSRKIKKANMIYILEKNRLKLYE